SSPRRWSWRWRTTPCSSMTTTARLPLALYAFPTVLSTSASSGTVRLFLRMKPSWEARSCAEIPTTVASSAAKSSVRARQLEVRRLLAHLWCPGHARTLCARTRTRAPVPPPLRACPHSLPAARRVPGARRLWSERTRRRVHAERKPCGDPCGRRLRLAAPGLARVRPESPARRRQRRRHRHHRGQRGAHAPRPGRAPGNGGL